MQETNDILISDYKQDYAGNNALAKDLIFMGGRQTYSLNGEWHYAIDQYDTCLRHKWFLDQYFDKDGRSLPVDFSFQDWTTIYLPCSVNTEKPELFWYEGPLVFTRTFSWDMQENMGKKVFLRIGAANYFSYIFLNGKYI